MTKAPLPSRIASAAKGVGRVLNIPRYLLLAIAVSLFSTGFIVWSLNFELLQFIFNEAPLNTLGKWQFFAEIHTGVYTALDEPQALGIVVFGLLFGVNISLIVYTLRRRLLQRIPKKSGGASVVIALISGGCAACGTSIMAPLFITLGITSSAQVAEISTVLSWTSNALLLYSIYKVGAVVQNTLFNRP